MRYSRLKSRLMDNLNTYVTLCYFTPLANPTPTVYSGFSKPSIHSSHTGTALLPNFFIHLLEKCPSSLTLQIDSCTTPTLLQTTFTSNTLHNYIGIGFKYVGSQILLLLQHSNNPTGEALADKIRNITMQQVDTGHSLEMKPLSFSFYGAQTSVVPLPEDIRQRSTGEYCGQFSVIQNHPTCHGPHES